jgi:L-lactate dehydrogenase complex protein LldG
MTSRERIRSAIRQHKPAYVPLPDETTFASTYPDRVAQFEAVLTGIGGTLVRVPDWDALRAHVRALFPDVTNVATTVPELSDLADFSLSVTDPHELAFVELALLPGTLGVAENGAIWLSEREMGHRALPFITQHLALVLRTDQLVGNLHDAYRCLRPGESGFGAFIAGPSKTADIEQSLVIGAHGARSLVVYLLGEPATA